MVSPSLVERCFIVVKKVLYVVAVKSIFFITELAGNRDNSLLFNDFSGFIGAQ
jgi:hypothetical protein